MTTDLTIGARQQGSADTDGMTYGELVRAVRVLGDAGARSGDQLRATVNRQHRLLTIAASVDPYRPTDPDDPRHDSALDRLTLAIVGLSERVDGLPDQLGYGEVQQGRLGVLTQALQLPPAPADYDDGPEVEMTPRGLQNVHRPLDNPGPGEEPWWCQACQGPCRQAVQVVVDPPPVTSAETVGVTEDDATTGVTGPETVASTWPDGSHRITRQAGSGQVQRDAEPFTPEGDR